LGMKEVALAANEIGQDIKVRSTIENLALIVSGQAKDISGNVITASTTNVVAKVNNMFDGMKMTLRVGEKEFEGYVVDVAEAAVSDTGRA